MKLPERLAALFLPCLLLASLAHGQIARSVDPLLGVAGGGNVFPGPVLPFGMIKPGPDMVAPEGHDANAGWNADGDIQAILKEISAAVPGTPKTGSYSAKGSAALLSHVFDKDAILQKRLPYEKLDQLSIDILLGVR